MATCIDLAGAEYPAQIADRAIDPLQGQSLLPIFKGEERAPHETLYFHFGNDRALRQGDWKLCHHSVAYFADESEHAAMGYGSVPAVRRADRSSTGNPFHYR
jgi:arylsulfatase A-like enzyme